jgi:hypothetical protein
MRTIFMSTATILLGFVCNAGAQPGGKSSGPQSQGHRHSTGRQGHSSQDGKFNRGRSHVHRRSLARRASRSHGSQFNRGHGRGHKRSLARRASRSHGSQFNRGHGHGHGHSLGGRGPGSHGRTSIGGRNGSFGSPESGFGLHGRNGSGNGSHSLVYQKFGKSGYCLPENCDCWSTSCWSKSYGCTIYYCSSDSQWYYYYPQGCCYLPCAYITSDRPVWAYQKFGTSGYCLPESCDCWSTSCWSDSYGCTIYCCSSDSQWYYYYPQECCYLPCEYIADCRPAWGYQTFGTSGYCLPESCDCWSTSCWSDSYGCTIYYYSSDGQWYYYYPQESCYLPCEYINDYPPECDDDTPTDDGDT